MKNLLFTLILFSFAIASFAQEHLSFKGIPIEGSMTSFCQKLKAKGFTPIGSDNNITMFTGDFTGKKSTVGVIASDDNKNVFSVAVFFAPSEEWKILVNTYDYYKELYSRKYGEPSTSTEYNPSHSDSNISLMQEVYSGTVLYCSKWEALGGDIQLSIEKTSKYCEGMVMIHYRDAQNIETKIQSDLNDI